MKTIYKYELEITDCQIMFLPMGFEIISVLNQREKPVVYALVDSDEKRTHKIEFLIKGTGHPIYENIADFNFLGTIDFDGLIFHFYYRKIKQFV